jgi:ABC-2 type transport system permease protein
MSRPFEHSISAARLLAMVRKEWLQILRDPSSLAIAFVMPLVLLLLFGYGVSLDARDVPVAVVVEQPSPETDRFTAGFDRSEYFRSEPFSSIQEAEQALRERRVDGIVWLRSDFTDCILTGREAPISVIVDGVNANQARLFEGYVQGAWMRWLAAYAASRGVTLQPAVDLEYRVWFNAALLSRDYLVPGLIAVIMTLIGALLTALIVAREWERGTLEAMLVSDIRVPEFLLGKLIPYFLLGMSGMLMTVAMAVWVFDVPLRGSFWVLLLASALFMCAALGMGLLISILARNQFVAGQIAIIVTFLPAFILSGFIFDIRSMPAVIQVITHIVPARYFVSVLQTVFLAGDLWRVIIPDMLALAAMATLFLSLVWHRFSKRLEQ